MTASVSGSGIGDSANRWSRILGVSLRPWSGESPASLVLRGGIQVALCGFFLWFALRLATDRDVTRYTDDLASVRLIATLMAVAALGVALLGLLRIGVGVIDFLSTSEVTGSVLSIRGRQSFDFLPHAALQLIYHRNPGRIDNRRRRTELVLQTASGTRQWTVRKHRVVRELRRGSTVRITVTPLAGHVSRLSPIDV